MLINQIENIPCQVVPAGHGLATITFTLPEESINAFVALLTSLAGLFRGLGWKSKTNIDCIHERIEQKKPVVEALRLEYENAVISVYSDFLRKGETPRCALSLTASKIIEQYKFSSFDQVKNCLTKNKMLKKTGFYKSRHKFE